MRLNKRISGILLAAVLLLLPTSGFAAAGAAALVGFVQQHIITQGLIAFWGISWAAMFYYAVRMVLDAHKESAMGDIANTFIYVFTGFAVIAISSAFASAFFTTGLSGSNATGISPVVLGSGIASVSNFIIRMSTGIFVLMIVICGIRMASTQGDQGQFDKWKHVLVANCIGVAMMLLASALVNGVAGASTAIIIEELRGIALFLLTLLGFVCVAALIIAGVYLIISIDESYRDKAKKIVIGTLITLVIVFIAYGLIATFVPVSTNP